MASQFIIGVIALSFMPLVVVVFWVFLGVVFLVLIAHAIDAPLPKPAPRATAGTLLDGPEEL